MTLKIDLATTEDDEALRRLLATNAVPGRVTVTYEREPNYFLGNATMGGQCRVLVARHDNAVVGVACRAVRELFVNGQVTKLGYLGQLRINEHFRGDGWCHTGFDFYANCTTSAVCPHISCRSLNRTERLSAC